MTVGVAHLSERLCPGALGWEQAAAQHGGQKYCMYRVVAHGEYKTSELSPAKLARISRQTLGLVESKIGDGDVNRVGGAIIEPVKAEVEIHDTRSRDGPTLLFVLEAGPRYPQGLRSGGKNGVITGSIAIGQIQAYVQMIASGECRHIDVYREAS